jgi:hypothetical protein|tara:strand:+ start:108 stop:743 length:636 start_codon:yes stop_codon:yes gene_type:complete
MNQPLPNSNNANAWSENEPSLASMVSPLRVALSRTSDGWCVEISSLTPCDAMMALAREDLLEDSTILCGSGESQWVACVNGPVEEGDANAIIREVSKSLSPLCADFRMQSVVTTNKGDGVTAHVRDYDDALMLAATAISQYMNEVLGGSVNVPDLGVVDTILHKTKTLSIRPIETEVFASFVDVGISTGNPNEPANTAIIYDIHSDSWHCD